MSLLAVNRVHRKGDSDHPGGPSCPQFCAHRGGKAGDWISWVEGDVGVTAVDSTLPGCPRSAGPVLRRPFPTPYTRRTSLLASQVMLPGRGWGASPCNHSLSLELLSPSLPTPHWAQPGLGLASGHQPSSEVASCGPLPSASSLRDSFLSQSR